jgi:hypothetical protein
VLRRTQNKFSRRQIRSIVDVIQTNAMIDELLLSQGNNRHPTATDNDRDRGGAIDDDE